MLHRHRDDAADHAASRPDPLSSLVWQQGLPHGAPLPAVIHAPRAGELIASHADTAVTAA
jgi:hypothetical protein